MRYIILFLFVIGFSTANAQSKKITVSGVVRDSVTSETLSSVVVSYSNSGVSLSNNYGFYSAIVSTGGVELTYSYLGYKKRSIYLNATSDTVVNVLLTAQAMELGEIVVRGGGDSFSRSGDGGKTVLSSSYLRFVPAFMGESDVLKYVQLQPGVLPSKEGASGINVRGGSSDQTLMLLDDVPIYNHAHAFGLVSVFSGDVIKTTELYKGYSPSSYGGRLSGVVAMQMREGDRYKHGGSIMVGTTTIGGNVYGRIGNKGKGSYMVSGRYFWPDMLMRGFYALRPKTDVMRTYVSFYDITAKANYDLGKKSTLYASFYTGHDAISFKYNEYTDGSKAYMNKSDGGIGWGNIAASLRFTSNVNSRSFLSTTLYYSHLANSNIYKFKDGVTTDKATATTKSKMDEYGLKLNMQHNIGSIYTINYGTLINFNAFNPYLVDNEINGSTKRVAYGKRDMFSSSMYVDNNIKYNRFNFNLGLRGALHSSSNQTEFSIEPRILAEYSVNRSKIGVSLVSNSQPMFSMSQAYSSMPVDYWLPFNSKTGISRSHQVSATYGLSLPCNLKFNAELYYKKSKNLTMVYDNDSFLRGDGGYVSGDGEAYGAEFTAAYLYRKFSVTASYAYSRSQINAEGKWMNFAYDTPHWFNLFATFNTLKTKAKSHNLSINVNYKTGLPYILSSEWFVVDNMYGNSASGGESGVVGYPKYPNTRLNNFFRIDVSYTMEKELKRGSRVWQVSLLNATAHKNPYIVYKSTYGYKAMSLIPFLPSVSYRRIF